MSTSFQSVLVLSEGTFVASPGPRTIAFFARFDDARKGYTWPVRPVDL